jgi:hypothetical protein
MCHKTNELTFYSRNFQKSSNAGGGTDPAERAVLLQAAFRIVLYSALS